MNEIITTILAQCEKLSEKELTTVTNALAAGFGRRIDNLIPQLVNLNHDELVLVNEILSGAILTKEYVPDNIQAYKELQDKDIPATISFGRIKKGSNN